ncbi:HD-GYP domain-containing protein [Magnetospirillum sp. UT-4]|uniref:HD-GYP domain-containing protein n=1 Tax=Magnetospirillum sp. UT-4 TaxID=2681467 RepID=UPI00137DDAF0|nr:HD domain-containing phosphohydrolase [Magnetospirillum sp. UT-4]CAA7627118.1 Cyclic di-GMP phosphodiesterase response regulator RpfG [Magnetospirillum sp. UT-4]
MLLQIVDDNETNLMLFEQIARRLGPEVEVACHADPLAGIAACEAEMPDLVLVDYMMPNMDGHEYVARVRAMPGGRDVPIVMVTAAAERSVRQKALELGVTDFLAKPVDPSEVRVRLNNLLALRKSHLKLKNQNRWLADEVAKATGALLEREEELIVRLARAAEFRDPETGGHIHRMAHYSLLIARNLNLPKDTCELILKAAPMHDIGKLGTPDGILLKPGRLDEEELVVMKRHPVIGHAILSGSTSQLIQLGAEIALSHHERWDGLGYPHGLKGEAIALPGRIVAVADVFDALTSDRPYKRSWAVERARDLLAENSGTHFEPACIDAFFGAWSEVLAIRERFADPELPEDAGLAGMV